MAMLQPPALSAASPFLFLRQHFVDTICSGFHSVVVPDQVIIALAGEPAHTVLARDIGMYLMSCYGDQIRNKAVLLTGSLIEKLTISEKMSICNFLPEAGVATALVLPQGEEYRPDIVIDSKAIPPMVAVPGDRPPSAGWQRCRRKK